MTDLDSQAHSCGSTESQLIQRGLPRILLVEGDLELRSSLRHALVRTGYEVTECCGACDLQVLLEKESACNTLAGFDVLLCDVQALDQQTRTLVLDHQQSQSNPSLVLINNGCDPDALEPCAVLNPIAVFEQPFEVSRHTRTIHKILNRHR
jgi:CheY-like chemotaxis protein